MDSKDEERVVAAVFGVMIKGESGVGEMEKSVGLVDKRAMPLIRVQNHWPW